MSRLWHRLRESKLGRAGWPLLVVLQAAVLVGVGYWLAWATLGQRRVAPADIGPGVTADAPQMWTCSMHPQIRQPGPGKCPICRMDLIPVTPARVTPAGLRTLSISPEARELMRLRTVPVQRQYVTAEVRMVGKVDFDETRLGYITAWVPGRLDRLYVDYTGIEVRQGDHMVSIYSPELYAAQQELLEAIRYQQERRAATTRVGPRVDLVQAAREKLRLLGLTPEQIEQISQQDSPSDHLTIYSPVSGVVIRKLKQEGDYVQTGERIYTVADLNQVWVMLDAYESDLPWIRYGQPVEFTTESYPGERFPGRISFIDPVLDDRTRTVKVRVNVPNPQGRLKPDMFVRAVVRSRVAGGGRVMDPSLAGKWICPMHPEVIREQAGSCDICGMQLVQAESLGYTSPETDGEEPPLVIPVSAALVTGTRAVVYVQVAGDPPTYEGREVVLGPRAGDDYLVQHGLKAGELVVVEGNFKLDSEIQIRAQPSMMTPEGGGGTAGHDHGEQPARAADQPAEHAGHAGMQIPPAVAAQLRQLDAVYQHVASATQSGDLPEIRAAYGHLGEALKQVEARRLSGHAAMLWKEFAMLLGNDAVEGRQARELDEAQRVFRSLTRHIQRVREELLAGDAGHATEAASEHAGHLEQSERSERSERSEHEGHQH